MAGNILTPEELISVSSDRIKDSISRAALICPTILSLFRHGIMTESSVLQMLEKYLNRNISRIDSDYFLWTDNQPAFFMNESTLRLIVEFCTEYLKKDYEKVLTLKLVSETPRKIDYWYKVEDLSETEAQLVASLIWYESFIQILDFNLDYNTLKTTIEQYEKCFVLLGKTGKDFIDYLENHYSDEPLVTTFLNEHLNSLTTSTTKIDPLYLPRIKAGGLALLVFFAVFLLFKIFSG